MWLHLPAEIPENSVSELRAALEDIHLLVTQIDAPLKSDLDQVLPAPRRANIDQFIAHWQPSVFVWGAPENGLSYARRVARAGGIKQAIADLAGQGLPQGVRGRQLIELLQYQMRVLHGIRENAEGLDKLGVTLAQSAHCGPLAEVAMPPPENEALLRRISGALGPRPIWCAAGVSRGEIGALLTAHRHAVKAIPNLLLIVVPRAASEVICTQIESEGWRVSRLNAAALPEKQTEILLADNTEDLGTWMRMATVSYMGGTLYGPEAADPFSAVAVGSAVLCGPMQAPYTTRYVRLKDAGAMAFAETNAGLPKKLVEALAPDASAALAMQAWLVGSEGAEVIQILVQEINALLEEEAT